VVKAARGRLSGPLFNGVVRFYLTVAGVNKDDTYEIGCQVVNGTQNTFTASSEADAMYGRGMQATVPDAYPSANTGNVRLTPGANVMERARR